MPTDCALLVAIPVDLNEVEVQWNRGSDFLRRYAGAVGARSPEELWTKYQPYASLCQRTIADVERMSVHVTLRATLADVAEAIEDHPVVTIVAHSRDGDFTADDILDACRASAVLTEIVAGTDQSIREVAGDAESVAEAFNRAIEHELRLPDDWHSLPSTARAAWQVRVLSERWARRSHIESLGEGTIKPGVGIEFADRFCSIDEIDRALPVRLGTLDLTVCESVLVADVLRRRRTHGVILSNADAATPDFRLLLYREAVALMRKRKHLSYVDAALTLRAHLKRTSWRQ